jgi:hypothetical protein
VYGGFCGRTCSRPHSRRIGTDAGATNRLVGLKPLGSLTKDGPHISLVFREMWDTTDVDRQVHQVNRESEGKTRGLPHPAKNERDMGHPSFAREPRGQSGEAQPVQAHARTIAPAAINRAPAALAKVIVSPRSGHASSTTKTTLNLSTGATFDASPMESARK